MPNDIFSRFESKKPVFEKEVSPQDKAESQYLTDGKSFCFTGALNRMKRADATTYVETMLGGKVKNTINSSTDFLVVADEAENTNKLVTTLRKYPHIKMIKESEFYVMIGYAVPSKK